METALLPTNLAFVKATQSHLDAFAERNRSFCMGAGLSKLAWPTTGRDDCWVWGLEEREAGEGCPVGTGPGTTCNRSARKDGSLNFRGIVPWGKARSCL